jgi:hypothetical protein
MHLGRWDHANRDPDNRYVFVRVNGTTSNCRRITTQDVRPVGMMTQLCRWRASESAQKDCSNIFTPAPSEMHRCELDGLNGYYVT